MKGSVLTLLLLLSLYALGNDYKNLSGEEKYKSYYEDLEKNKYRDPKKAIATIDSLIENDNELDNYTLSKIDFQELKGRILLMSAKFEESIETLKVAKESSIQQNYLKGKGKSILCLGSAYGILGKDSLAYKNLYEGFAYLEELQDSLEIAAGCNHLGLFLKTKGELDKALDFYQRAQLIYETENDISGLFKVINNQALIWKNDQYEGNDEKNNYEVAISLFQQALELADQLDNEYYKASVYVNMSGTYTNLRSDTDTAYNFQLYRKSLDYAKKSNEIFMSKKMYYRTAPTKVMISAAFWNLEELDSAEYYAKEALKIVEEYKKNYQVESTAYETLGLIEAKRGINFKKAEKYTLKALQVAQEHNLIFKENKIIGQVVNLYVKMNDYKKAYLYQEKYLEINKELNDEAEFKKLSRLQAGYENKRLERDKKLKELQYQASLKEKQLWIGIAILFVTLAVVVFSLYIKNNRLKSSQLKVAKEKERLSVEREKRLEELDQFKTKFFANISHEFRTPLTLMMGAINELREKVEKDNKFLNILDYQSSQLLSLINQILDLTSFELQDNAVLRLAKYNIKELLDVTVASFHSYAEQKEVAITLDYKGELEGYINKSSIDKIVNNLIYNAIKFSKQNGEIKLTVNANQDMLTVQCYDNGSGIDKKDLPYIFDQYYHSNVGLSTTNGIGLALTRELINKYKGEITVDSEKGEWTRFTINLPISIALIEKKGGKVEVEKVQHSKKEQSKHPILKDELQKEESAEPKNELKEKQDTILVIDDNEAIRNYLYDILEDHYNVVLEVDGQKGFEKAKEIIPDLVISDVMMPEVNGLEMTKLLKNTHQTSHIPIILLTAKADQSSLIEGYQTKAEAYITKPFVKQDLLVRIENILENRKLLQAKFRESFLVKEELMEFSDNDEKLIKELTSIVENNLDNSELSVEEVAKELFISRSQLHRKIKALTGKSSSVFIRDIRLRYAKELILKSDDTIAEVAYKTGFNTPTYFSKCFSDLFGISPTQLRENQGV